MFYIIAQMKCKIISGEKRADSRGMVSFVNNFTFEKVKRFYQVESKNNSIIRAFHGHMKEGKYAYVTAGKMLLCAVYLDVKNKPSKKNKVERFILSSDKPQILFIPPRHANGFKSLKARSKVIFFSTSSLKESLRDDYRFPYDYWGKEVWKT